MAEDKKKRVITKVSTSLTTTPTMDSSLDKLALTSYEKFADVEIKVIVKKVDNEIKKSVIETFGTVTPAQQEIADALLKEAVNSTNGVADANVKLVYKADEEIL